MNSSFRKLIKELVEEELSEVSTSGAAGPYNTPFAFRGNTSDGKAKAKKIASQAGMEPVKGKDDKADEIGDEKKKVVPYGKKGTGALKKPSKDKVVQETKKSK